MAAAAMIHPRKEPAAIWRSIEKAYDREAKPRARRST